MKRSKKFKIGFFVVAMYLIVTSTMAFAVTAQFNAMLEKTNVYYAGYATKTDTDYWAYVTPTYMVSPNNSAVYVRVRNGSDLAFASGLGSLRPDLSQTSLEYWSGYNVVGRELTLAFQNTVSGSGHVSGYWEP